MMIDNIDVDLYRAIEQNDLAEIRRLLEAGATCEPTPEQKPFLHLAVESGNADIVAMLLDHDCDINIATKQHTALSLAAAQGDITIVRLLLARGADPNLKRPLYHALDHGRHTETALALIEAGADVNAPVDLYKVAYGAVIIRSYLVWALFKRMPEVALALIEHGADVHDLEALPMAAYRGHTDVVEALLARGVRNPDALYLAAKHKRKECLRVLVSAHGVGFAPHQRGWTLLHMAAYSGCPDLIDQWFEAGGEADVYDDKKNTPLLFALQQKNYECAQLLTAHGADLRARNRRGATPWYVASQVGVLDRLPDRRVAAHTDPCAKLHAAVQMGDVETATHLLDGGLTCPPEADQMSLFHLAVKFDNAPLTRLLLKHGYDPNHKASVDEVGGHTPLHLAAQYARPSIINALIRSGADIEAQTAYKHTPLRFAVAASRLAAVRALLKAGARASATHVDVLLSVKRYNGRTFTDVSPKDFKKRPRYHEIAALLIEHIQDPHERAQSEQRYQKHLSMRLKWAITGYDKRKNALHNSLERGADPNTPIGPKRWPLHMAAERCNIDAVAQLIEYGAEVNGSTSFGYTPLHYAACCEDPQIVELLLQAGADPGAQIGGGSRLAGWTPLHFAHSHQNEAAIRLLEPVSPPLSEPVAPGSHGLSGYRVDTSNAYRKPFEVIGPTRRMRCHVCGEYALYRVGEEWDGTNPLHAECTSYYRCANCNAKGIQDESGYRPYKGSLNRWREVEHEDEK